MNPQNSKIILSYQQNKCILIHIWIAIVNLVQSSLMTRTANNKYFNGAAHLILYNIQMCI